MKDCIYLIVLMVVLINCDQDNKNKEDTINACQDNEDNDNDNKIDCEDEDCAIFEDLCKIMDSGVDIKDAQDDLSSDLEQDLNINSDGGYCSYNEQCNDHNDCTENICDPHTGECLNPTIDVDEDGHFSIQCGGDDCDDINNAVFTGADDICDIYDNDCDTVINDGICCSPQPQQYIIKYQGLSSNPSSAWSGNNYGVVWEDNRNGTPEIYFGLFDENLEINSFEIRVTNINKITDDPQIVFNGEKFVIAWTDGRAGSTQIWLRSVDQFGNLLNDETKITSSDNDSKILKMIYQNNYLWILAFQKIDEISGDLYVYKVSNNTVEKSKKIVSNSNGDADFVWSGFAGSQLGILWFNVNNELYFSSASDSLGNIYSSNPILQQKQGANWAKIVWDGNQYAAVWSDKRDGYEGIYFIRLNSSGDRISEELKLSDDYFSTIPSIVINDSGFLVLWKDVRIITSQEIDSIYSILINYQGEIEIPRYRLIEANPIDKIELVLIPGNVFMLWTDPEYDEGDIFYNVFNCISNVP